MPVSILGLGLCTAVLLAALWLLDPWVGVALVVLGMGAGALVVGAGGRSSPREAELDDRERHLQHQRTALIQTVSHEFRTPLTIIHGVAETLLERQGGMAPALRPLAPALHRAERRLSDMVAVVLAAADALGGPLEQALVDVEELVGEVAEDLGTDAVHRIRVHAVGDAQRVVTSRSHVRLLLRVLLDNAVRFSEEGDAVDVEASLVNGSVMITIRDRGEGVDPAFLERAFEPFTQADSSTLRERGGLGLGLYTARQLARRLGGDVDVRPAADVGSVAVVHLPQRREADAADVPRVISR